MDKFKKINAIGVLVIILISLFLIVFFSMEEKDIMQNILEKYPTAEVLSTKSINGSQMFFFACEENKIGIINYVKAPFVDRYFYERSYTQNINGNELVIYDVFEGQWHSTGVEARSDKIKVFDIVKFTGFYMLPIYLVSLLLIIDYFLYIFRYQKRWPLKVR